MTASVLKGDAPRGNGWRMAVWGAAACLLLLPLVAMQFTAEVKWTGSDFAVWGVMLGVACGTYELATRMTRNSAYRAAVAVAVVAAFLLVWINLAVGIIGAENNPANLMFAGVIAVAIAGGAMARFRAQGMARALVATALAQAMVAAIVLVRGLADEVTPIIVLTGLFVALWLGSAWLFGRAARAQAM
ncbi:MAG TPA: hypothetical protein VK980_17200 [Sphingomonas sp.]|nr:hypothetical protein [Sphingomonas sp.]